MPEMKPVEAKKPKVSLAKKVVKKPTLKDYIAINLAAQVGDHFSGYELLQALLANGLRYGDMHIFHRHEEVDGGGKVLFSLASSEAPGTFELSKMGGYECKGLAFFMSLTAKIDLAESFEIMINTAQQLAEELKGRLLDEQQEPLTEATIAQYRAHVKRAEGSKDTADFFD